MNAKNDKFENFKDTLAGEAKEPFGKVTGNEPLELEGKIQSSKVDLKRKTNMGTNMVKAKNGFAGKINKTVGKKDFKIKAKRGKKKV